MPNVDHPVLYVVACGGRPAADLPAFVTEAQADGWHVCVIATPSAVKFMDLTALATITGHQVRYDYKQPDEPDVLPPPHAFVIAPATFNTINKLVSGASDTLALGMLNEAIGMPLPIIAVPTPNVALARHPAFQASVQALRSWGVDLLFDPERYPLPTPNMGPPAAGLFPWADLASVVSKLRETIVDGIESAPAVDGKR
jgi:phosphopantothenoylcysteine synthetase/decarboxylase